MSDIGGNVQMSDIGGNVQMSDIGGNVQMSDIGGNVHESIFTPIADKYLWILCIFAPSADSFGEKCRYYRQMWTNLAGNITRCNIIPPHVGIVRKCMHVQESVLYMHSRVFIAYA
jgi:hypothetical protein